MHQGAADAEGNDDKRSRIWGEGTRLCDSVPHCFLVDVSNVHLHMYKKSLRTSQETMSLSLQDKLLKVRCKVKKIKEVADFNLLTSGAPIVSSKRKKPPRPVYEMTVD